MEKLLAIKDFVLAHQLVLSTLGVAVLDFAIELHPSLKGNNIVSFLLGFLKKKEAPVA
jgi:hypothetical protein